MRWFITSVTSVLAIVTVSAVLTRVVHAQKKAVRVSERMLQLTNDFRKQNGVAPLRASSTLNNVAQRYAKLMAEKDEAGHHLDGQDAGKRISAAGYSAAAWAENVAWNDEQTGSITAAIEWWKKSTQGHRENMLNGQFTEVGFGATLRSKSGKYYYCAVFAKPR